MWRDKGINGGHKIHPFCYTSFVPWKPPSLTWHVFLPLTSIRFNCSQRAVICEMCYRSYSLPAVVCTFVIVPSRCEVIINKRHRILFCRKYDQRTEYKYLPVGLLSRVNREWTHTFRVILPTSNNEFWFDVQFCERNY